MAPPLKGETRREHEGESLRTLLLPPTLPCVSTFWWFSFLGTLQCQVLAVGHNGRHPKNWLSGVPSEVVASFADAFTSVSVLAEPALPGDVTAAEGHTCSFR